MGCFSFLCKNSGEAALSTSFNGSPCYLFLLKDGKVIEEMYGNYDSYGRVFKTELREDVPHDLFDSFEWSLGWSKVCDLMYNEDNSNGIAMVLEKNYTGNPPTTRSDNDPNQGWGSDEDDEEDYLFDNSDGPWPRVTNPHHKVY